MNYYSKNDSSEYNDPEYRQVLDELLNAATSGDVEKYANLKQILSAAKANVTRRNRLEATGVDTAELLRPAEETGEPGGLASWANEMKPYGRKAMSTLGGILKIADTDRNFVAKNLLVPLLGLQKELGNKEEVFTSDILGAMGMEEGALRGGLGLAGDIFTAPSTYLTGGVAAGARMVGGRALTKAGMTAGKGIAERLAKKDTLRKLLKDIPKEVNLSKIPKTTNRIKKDADKKLLDEYLGLANADTLSLDQGRRFSELFDQLHEKIPNSFYVEKLKGNELIRSNREKLTKDIPSAERTYETQERAFKILEKMARNPEFVKTNKDFFQRGGLKFAGQTIVPQETLNVIGRKSKGALDMLSKVPIAGRIYEGLKPVGHRLGKAFIHDYGLPEEYKAIKEWGANTNAYREGMVIERTSEILKGLPSKYIDDPNVQTLGKLQEVIGSGESDAMLRAQLGIADADWVPLKKAATAMRKEWDRVGTELKNEGVINKFIDNYAAHLYELKKKLPYARKVRIGSYGELVQKLKADRLFNTIDEAEQYIKSRPEIDSLIRVMAPGDAYAIKMLSAEKALTEQQVLGKVVSQLGKGMDKAGHFRKTARFADENLVPMNYNNKEYWIPSEVDNDLMEMKNSGIIGQAELGDLMKTFDSWQNWFKKYVTIPFPSFHVRNLYSDMYRAGLRSLTGIANPKIYKASLGVMLGDPNKMAGKFFKTKSGTQIPIEEIYKQFRMNGLMRHEIGRADIQRDILKAIGHKDGKKLLSGYMDIVQKSAIASENHTKLVHFLMNLDDGLDFAQAAKTTKKFHYDYQALTEFEKKFMRRLIPFYPWLRKNTAFMLRSFAERPGKMLATIRMEEYGLGEILGKGFTEEEKESLPEFMREQISVPLFGTMTGDMNVLTNIDLPIDELNELGIGLSGWRALAKSLGGRMSPALKYPLEMLAGKDFYFGTPLSEKAVDLETGETRYPYNKAYDYMAKIPGLREFLKVHEVETKSGKTKHVLDPKRRKVLEMILGGGTGSRAMSEANKLAQLLSGDTAQKKSALLNILTGLKIYPIDVEEQKKRKLVGGIRQKQQLLSNQ